MKINYIYKSILRCAVRKNKVVIVLCFILLMGAVLCACDNQKTELSVKLYDGENLIKEAPVEENKEYDFGAPDKVGYIFLGWYSEPNGGKVLTDAKGKSAGITWKSDNPLKAYAHWEAKKYKITLDYCGATALNTITDVSATYDAEISEKLPVPQKSGYSFLGWYTAKNKGNQITDASGAFLESSLVYNESVYPLNSDGTTLYAHWGEKTVTYMFVTGDGTPVSQISCSVGAVLNTLPTSIKDNHCFASWCFDSTMISELTFPHTVKESSDGYVTLYANFIPATTDILQYNIISSTSDKEYEVSYSGNAEKIVIPDSYYGKKITKIKSISAPLAKEIVIPQTVLSLSGGAFMNCHVLEKINIPNAVTEIPENCFSGCGSLKNINIPFNVNTISNKAFWECASITEINISSNVTSIKNGAFGKMDSLKKFTVDADNESYLSKDDVLYSKVGISLYLIQYPAAKQDETYNIDAATVKISKYAFSNSEISTIVIGGKISSIDEGAFENCTNLANISLVSNSLAFTIGPNAFLNCINLRAMKIEMVNIPFLNETALTGVSNVFSVYVSSDAIRNYQTATNWNSISDNIYSLGTIFGNFAIEEVEGGYTVRQYFGTEKEVVIPEILNAHQIVKISEDAFSFSKMEKVTVSQYIKEIDNNAFKNCTSLKSIVMECEPPLLGENVFENINADFGIYIKNTTDVLDAYKSASKWSEISSYIWSYQ